MAAGWQEGIAIGRDFCGPDELGTPRSHTKVQADPTLAPNPKTAMLQKLKAFTLRVPALTDAEHKALLKLRSRKAQGTIPSTAAIT